MGSAYGGMSSQATSGTGREAGRVVGQLGEVVGGPRRHSTTGRVAAVMGGSLTASLFCHGIFVSLWDWPANPEKGATFIAN